MLGDLRIWAFLPSLLVSKIPTVFVASWIFLIEKTYLDIFIKQKDIFIKGKLIDIKNYKTCFEEILQTPVAGCP